MGLTDPKEVKAIVLKLPYHLDKLASLIQSSYIPTGYFSFPFQFQRIHSRGVNSLQGLVDSRHLSSPLASVIPVTTNACFSDVGFRNSNSLGHASKLKKILSRHLATKW